MKVGLIQVDGKMPNLALMKLSAWHKAQGDSVILLTPSDVLIDDEDYDPYEMFDHYYAATVFTESKPIVDKLIRIGIFDIGGTGWDINRTLHPKIEAMKPDYELYGIDYGMGFTSRGCIRSCQFCVVPEKEGYIREVCMPIDLLNPKSNKLVLLDNNFFASLKWREKAQQIISNRIHVDFTQGLDIRLVDKEVATAIRLMRHIKRVHFAFDNLEISGFVRRGIEHLLSVGFYPDALSFYVLTNFNTTIQEDLERVNLLLNYGVNPFVMIYDREHAPRQVRDLARWCNRPALRKSCKFEDYKKAV